MSYCYRCGQTTNELVHTATSSFCGRCAKNEYTLVRSWLPRVELFDNLAFATRV